MNKDIFWFLKALAKGVLNIFDWYKNRASSSYRGPFRLPAGIFLILLGLYAIFDFFNKN